MPDDSTQTRLLVIHGPNLNMLGEREPGMYGDRTLSELTRKIRDYAESKACRVRFFQSNGEGTLIDFIQDHRLWTEGLLINPGALTHTSYALRDAVAGIEVPAVEVHLSDIKKREPFRSVSVIAPVCAAQVYGKGVEGYFEGIDILLEAIRDESERP